MRLTKQQTTTAYWVATGLLALFMTKSALAYLTQDAVRVECQHLGFPDYFRVELALAKFLGVLALLAPVGPRPKEWAYAGFAILLGSVIVGTWPRARPWAPAPGRSSSAGCWPRPTPFTTGGRRWPQRGRGANLPAPTSLVGAAASPVRQSAFSFAF